MVCCQGPKLCVLPSDAAEGQGNDMLPLTFLFCFSHSPSSSSWTLPAHCSCSSSPPSSLPLALTHLAVTPMVFSLPCCVWEEAGCQAFCLWAPRGCSCQGGGSYLEGRCLLAAVTEEQAEAFLQAGRPRCSDLEAQVHLPAAGAQAGAASAGSLAGLSPQEYSLGWLRDSVCAWRSVIWLVRTMARFAHRPRALIRPAALCLSRARSWTPDNPPSSRRPGLLWSPSAW